MLIIAEQKTTRQSPRKVRLVANSVRKLSLQDALKQLSVMEKRASLVVTKVIRQALADAMHNHRLDIDQVVLKNIIVNGGATYKRWRAGSRGRAKSVYKRTSHVRVILETKNEQPAVKAETKTAVKEIKAETKTAVAKKPAPKKAAAKKAK